MKVNAKLLSITIERFKSFEAATAIELAPLTIIHGRNNGGKSSIIQSLLLLKQTLADPRSEVPLKFEGLVDAFNVRELTHGWPSAGDAVRGPAIRLEWESAVDLRAAHEEARKPDMTNFVSQTGLPRFGDEIMTMRTHLAVEFAERFGNVKIARICVGDDEGHRFVLRGEEAGWKCYWDLEGKPLLADKIDIELDHFIPYLRIVRKNLGPRHTQRAWYNAYLFLFAQPLEALKGLLGDLQYLGSVRAAPPSLYRASSIAPHEIGASGEFAAQLLHRRQRELVHYLPPLDADSGAGIPAYVHARPLVDSVNDVLVKLGIDAPLKVDDIQDVGFRLLFGEASLAHVGRGLTYLLPMIELGLLADPLKFSGQLADMTLEVYRESCGAFTHVAMEEPEAHLHPKVQSRLAHWLVSLAMANRRLLVETHSDHLVRRLRGLVARAGRGTELERWLLDNVVILGVEQDAQGRSAVTSTRLTAEGGVGEVWPTDFMDEASSEESAIYYAGLDKAAPLPNSPGVEFDDGEEPNLEVP